ncbi:MAG: hypothetical protein JNK04_23065 [Myxococcales bacterium]|nr:hypothetical protein [Myxococcales bacterium]
MLFARTLLASLAGVTALGVALFAGCSDDGSTGGGGPVDENADVIYVGGMTDEALEALLAAPLETNVDKTAAFTWPEPGAQLAPGEPFEFCWHIGPVAAGPRTKSDRRLGSIPRETLLPARFEKTTGVEAVATGLLKSLLSGVPSAHAHGTPVDGPGYFLVISTESDPKLVRVFTNVLDYTIEPADWERMKKVGGEMTAKVIWADFETNRVLNDGGPWDGTPVTFSIAAE